MRAGNALAHRAGSSLSSTLSPTDFKCGHPLDHIDTTSRRMRVLRLCMFPCMYVSTFFVVFVELIDSENTSWKATPTQSEIDCLESGSALPALLGPCCWCKCLAADADADADSGSCNRRRGRLRVDTRLVCIFDYNVVSMSILLFMRRRHCASTATIPYLRGPNTYEWRAPLARACAPV